jgi:hypothetical protein
MAIKAASSNIPMSRVLVEWLDSSDASLGYSRFSSGAFVYFDTSWRRYTLFAIKPATATKIRLAVGEVTGATVPADSGSFTLYLDDVQLSESPGTVFTYIDVGSSRVDINRPLGLQVTGTPAYADEQAHIYVRNNRLIVQYRDPSFPPTTRYKYLDLTGTGVTWVHTTTAP